MLQIFTKPTITGKSIVVEHISIVAAACVAIWSVEAVLVTQVSSQHTFISGCIMESNQEWKYRLLLTEGEAHTLNALMSECFDNNSL